MVTKGSSELPEIHVLCSNIYVHGIQDPHQTKIPLKTKPYIFLIASYLLHWWGKYSCPRVVGVAEYKTPAIRLMRLAGIYKAPRFTARRRGHLHPSGAHGGGGVSPRNRGNNQSFEVRCRHCSIKRVREPLVPKEERDWLVWVILWAGRGLKPITQE